MDIGRIGKDGGARKKLLLFYERRVPSEQLDLVMVVRAGFLTKKDLDSHPCLASAA